MVCLVTVVPEDPLPGCSTSEPGAPAGDGQGHGQGPDRHAVQRRGGRGPGALETALRDLDVEGVVTGA